MEVSPLRGQRTKRYRSCAWYYFCDINRLKGEIMLNLTTITTQLHQLKVVPVIALDHAEDILPLADTLVQNGLPGAEIGRASCRERV